MPIFCSTESSVRSCSHHPIPGALPTASSSAVYLCLEAGRFSESTNHFFFECSRFNIARSRFLAEVSPILKLFDRALSVPSVLGMFDFLVSKPKERETRHLRQQLLNHTLRFLADTCRFTDAELMNGRFVPQN